MKSRSLLLLLSSVCLLLAVLLFSWVKTQCAAPIPVPSRPGGYYADTFVLELSAPKNGKIHYTTDGSIPTAESAVYQEGICLQDRSRKPNVYNAVPNIVRDWKSYTPNPTPVPKGTVIRACFINDWGFQSPVLTQTYFVGLNAPDNGYTLSLIFEDADLFGGNGIYVTGQEYDTWYTSGDSLTPEPVPNFQKHLEVPVIAELMVPSGDVMNQPVGLRLQGNSMRGATQKRFILEAYPELSGTNLFTSEIFPDTSTHSVMTKGSTVDSLVYDLVSDRFVAVQKSVPVRLFLNGEYLYDWYLLERYDNRYFRQYYDVDDVILVKSGEISEDVTIDRDAYGELMYWAAHTDFSEEHQWQQIQSEIDLQSYIDFISINYFLCNWDFSDDKNHLLWRSTVDGKSPYADKRWRWCIYDVDALEVTLMNFPVENAAEVNIFSCELPFSEVKVNETVLFRALKQHPDFQQQFVLSFMDILNNNFSISKVTEVLEKHKLSIHLMDDYFLKRPDYAIQHLAQEFHLTGSPETAVITAEHPERGRVIVNTSQIDLTNGHWSGKYFTDYPITVTAIANDGYEFLGWKGDADTTDDTITLHLDDGVVLEAMFAEAP